MGHRGPGTPRVAAAEEAARDNMDEDSYAAALARASAAY